MVGFTQCRGKNTGSRGAWRVHEGGILTPVELGKDRDLLFLLPRCRLRVEKNRQSWEF
jgi:hypothetical protein